MGKKSEKDRVPKAIASEIRNKHKRQEIHLKQKVHKEQLNKLGRLKRQKLREEHGEEACPKEPMRTIESMRVKDETIITDANDEDLLGEHDVDEFANYFKGDSKPKILMTTNRRPKGSIFHFLKEVKTAFPNCEYYERKNF